MTKLTVNSIKAVKPAEKDFILWDDELKGFGLKVTPTGRRSYLFAYRTADKIQRKPKIGDYPAMKPEAAREAARLMYAKVRAGGDPSGEKKTRRSNRGKDTIREMLTDYLKAKSHLKSVKEIERTFNHDILPNIGHIRVDELKKTDVSHLIDKLGARSVSTAITTRRQLSAFYRWCLPRMDDGLSNPVSNAAKLPPLASRERFLSEHEIATLWTVLENETDVWRRALRLFLLTGQRRSEVLQANWNEFDLDKECWTIPAARTKNKKQTIVPLSPAAISILMEFENRTGLLFPKGTGSAGKAAARICKAMGADIPHWRWHDLRRTVATGLQRLGVQLPVTEAILNHISGSRSGIVGVYQVHDWANEKREAMIAWGREVERIIDANKPALFAYFRSSGQLFHKVADTRFTKSRTVGVDWSQVPG